MEGMCADFQKPGLQYPLETRRAHGNRYPYVTDDLWYVPM